MNGIYDYATLAADPQGEESWLDRPDGTRLRMRSAGAGDRTVLLAHGYAVTMMEWNVVTALLVDAGYRVITFDQRGHGKSTIGTDGIGSLQMAGDYLAIMEHWDLRDVLLVGQRPQGLLPHRPQAGILDEGDRVRDGDDAGACQGGGEDVGRSGTQEFRQADVDADDAALDLRPGFAQRHLAGGDPVRWHEGDQLHAVQLSNLVGTKEGSQFVLVPLQPFL